MKFRTLFYAASAALLALVSCSKASEDDGTPYIHVNGESTATLEFTSASGDQTVKVKSNREWKVEDIEDEWVGVNVSGTQKAGEQTVEVTVTSNASDDAFNRSCDIVFTNGTQSATLTVTQQGAKGDNTPLLSVSFKEGIPDGWTIDEKTAADASVKVWTADTQYGCAKATAYINSTNHASESWLISPVIDLSSETAACLCFRHAGNYFSNIKKEVSVKAREENGTWADLTVQTYPSSFTYVDSGDCDLSNYVGKKMQIAFAYTSTSSSAGTWEVDNVNIYKRAATEVETEWVNTISELLALDDSKKAGIKNVLVVETYSRGYIISDGTDYYNVYVGATPTVKAGDKVNVQGTTGNYYNYKQLGDVESEVLSSGNTVLTPTFTDITSTFDSFTSTKIACVQVTGKISISGSYYNFTVDGASTKTGSIAYPTNTDELKGYDGVKCQMEGYFVYASGGSGQYINLVLHSIAPAAGYFTASPATQTVESTATSAKISVKTDKSWTATASAGATISAASGTSDAEVTVSFPANTKYEAASYTVTFTVDGLEPVTVTIKQNAAVNPDATYVELTNAEIVAALTANNSTSTSYVTTPFTYSSASGNWTAISAVCKNNPYIQIRNSTGSYLLSPVFSKAIEKIEITANTSSSNVQNRTIYALPADTVLPTTSDKYSSNSSIIANNYGSAVLETNSGKTTTLTINAADVKQVKLITYDGAAYINSIKVYFK